MSEVHHSEHNVMQAPAREPAPAPEPSERPRRIAMLAPPWIPVPPPGYGGIEFVLALLCDALVARGHDVELFCAPGSRSAAKVHPLLDRPHPEAIERSLFEADHVARAFAAIDAAAAADEPFELVHDHCGYTPLAMCDRLAMPLVHTVHGPFDEDTTPFYALHGSKGSLVCISHSQASFAPVQANVAAVVHNPIDVDAWPVGHDKEEWLLWVGRFVPEKGPQRAIRVARAVGRPLVLAGTVQPRFERFFATEIEPHIDGTTVRYVGEVGGAHKQRLFAQAFAFLMPIRWPEPFGMVMVEALAVGTPVLAFSQGAAPEIIEHGVNGFLVNDEDGMVFCCLVCEHADWTGSLELFRELRPAIESALRWIDAFGDLDGDGLLEYRRRSTDGLVNQGWKDSWDGIVDEHGALLAAPIALVEVQGYAVAAKRRLAGLFELDGDPERARELLADAERRAGLLEQFWLSDRGFYAMALDAGKGPSRALASNQGHLLWARAVPQARAAAIRDALMGADAYSGWGVRTLGANERAFNPVGYHTGTVWPHDNALFAVGLRKYGFDAAFLRVFEDLLDAVAGFPVLRLPELFAGFSRADYEDPVLYPVACRPQAWAAGALPFMLVAGVGLVPRALERTLRIRRPSLPRQLDRLAVRGLRVADARVDLLFERVGPQADRVALTDVRIDGDVDVALEISAEPAGVP